MSSRTEFVSPILDRALAAVDSLVATGGEPRLSVQGLSAAVGLRVRSLRRAWSMGRQASDNSGARTLRELIVTARINLAARQIEAGEKIMAVRAAVGYRDTSSFNRQFRRRFGCTPQQYRDIVVARCER